MRSVKQRGNPEMKQPAIYITTNKRNGTLYTGVTSNLVQRTWQHKNKVIQGFAAKYNCSQLVYYELFDDMTRAIQGEKQIKAGFRKRKLMLIESINPSWKDLYSDINA